LKEFVDYVKLTKLVEPMSTPREDKYGFDVEK